MKIVFMGTPSFSVPVLEGLNEKYEIDLVITKHDRIEGRKRELIPTKVKEKALELGLKIFETDNIKEDYLNIETDADVLVTAAFGEFVPTKFLSKFKYCINVHGSLLPKRRGGAPIQRSIIEGDAETGVTIMEMVKKMDAGRIYAKRSIPILDSDNNTSMFEKLSYIGRDLLLETIEDIYNGKNGGVPQNEDEVTISYNLTKEEEEFNFNLDSRTIFNKIRGLSHEPGAYFIYNDIRFKVYEAKIVEGYDGVPGEIVETNKHLIIKTLTDSIELLCIQQFGKKEMKVKDYLNGQRIFVKGEVIKA